MKVRIDNMLIGERETCYILAGAGVNHNGSVEQAKKLIDAAKDAGAGAVKFQTFNADNIVTKKSTKSRISKRNYRRRRISIRNDKEVRTHRI